MRVVFGRHILPGARLLGMAGWFTMTRNWTPIGILLVDDSLVDCTRPGLACYDFVEALRLSWSHLSPAIGRPMAFDVRVRIEPEYRVKALEVEPLFLLYPD